MAEASFSGFLQSPSHQTKQVKRGSKGKRYAPTACYRLKESRVPILTEAEKREFAECEFPFENLAFEGGGSKSMSYVGVIRVLEELGIMKNIKRFAGSSAGSIVATYSALGYDSYEIQELLGPNFSPLIYDGKWGIFGRLVNLVRNLGAHPGKKLERWIGDNVCNKTGGDRNFTFRQLYKERDGVELCMVGADLNMMDAVYFHAKTTPKMPICLAARASASIPAILRPVKFRQNYFVDGGLLCNYPVHAFDGWYLSMDREDNFFERLCKPNVSDQWDMSKRFGTVNKKTLGILLFSASEQDTMKTDLDDRVRKYAKEVPSPDTKLKRKKEKNFDEKQASKEKIKDALVRLVNMLGHADADKNGTVSIHEFRNSFKELSDDDIDILFNGVKHPDDIFKIIDTDNSGEIEYSELVQLAGKRDVDLLQTLCGYERHKIKGITQLLGSLVDTVLLNVQRVTTRSSDYQRTIGINTQYLEAFDWDMEQEDKTFLIECGKQATLGFLREYISRQTPC
ncbi:uncharacterized protein [Asterias amurensis]|uniref:uncharacterized protein n=1 Tax=Asterias amurensis TaxID=7602 RepID=UPI003AB364D3